MTKKTAKRTPKYRPLGKLKSHVKLGQKKCAKASLRAVMPPGRPDVRIVICCPPDKWQVRAKKCKVSLKAHAKKKYALKKG